MKKISMIIFLIGLVFADINIVYASSGFLRKNSIKTCNGVSYGQHSSDNHWHKAVLNDNGGYNAEGDPIYSDPCGNNQNNNNINNNSGNSANNTSVIKTPVVKSSDATLLSLKVDNNAIGIADNMSYTTKMLQ